MALVEFYIKNYNQNGTTVTTETLFQTIPLTSEWALINPKVKGTMGKADSFEFGMELGHPLYDAMMQMKTILHVKYAGTTIFRGRVVTVDKGMERTRNVHCEGAFAYFLDTTQEGTKEETRPEIGVLEYLKQIVDKHNADVEAEKQFTLGQVPGQYYSVTAEQQVKIPEDKARQQFGSSSWNTSMDRLEDLLNNFGGYMRVRYDQSNGVNYLDWYDKYYDAGLNSQPIQVASNLIDLSGTTEVENLFTILLPIGKSQSDNVYIDSYWPSVSSGHAQVKYITVPELATLGLYTDAELNADYHRKADYQNAITRYGKIWKTVSFDNADTPDKLFAYAKDWIKNNYMPEMTQWNVTALDLRTVDNISQPLRVGDRVTLIHTEVDLSYGAMTVIGAEYDIYNPDKTKYTIGIPNQLLNAAYGVKQKQESSSPSGGKGGGGGISSKPPPTDNVDEEISKIKREFYRQYSLKTDFGEDIVYDDAFAFLNYDTHGNKLSGSDAIAKLKPYVKDINTGYEYYKDREKYNADAKKYGFDPDDPKTLQQLAYKYASDRNPQLKKEAEAWKWNFEIYLQQDLGLSRVQAEIITNTSVGTSWLASLVNDQGNWTRAALREGVHEQANAEEIRKQAIAVRRMLQKKDGLYPGTTLLNGIQQYIVGESLNLSNFLNFDGDELVFNLGEMFNLDGVKNIFKLISNALALDGENGTGLFGWHNDRWNIGINTAITYRDIDGVERTVGGDGQISAQDFNIPEIPSFKSKFAYIDEIVATKATIAELRAYEALLGGGTPVVDAKGNVSFEGTALQTNAKHILGVNGKFDIDDTGTLRIIEGGGMKILRDGVEYGVYDNGSLTGGIVVDKINDGTVTTRIKGSKIVIGDDVDGTTLPSWCDTTTGLIAQKATIVNLNAVKARVEKIESDYLKTGELYASIAALEKVSVKSLTSERGRISVYNVATTSLKLGGADVPYSMIIRASVSDNTLTLTPLAGKAITFSKATTLQVEYGGDNKGDTATYKVTATPQGNEVTGSFKVHQNKTAVWITDPNGTIRARIDNPQYDNGWTAAYSKLSLPSTSNTTDTMTVKYPSVTVDTAGTDINYKVSVDDSYAYIKRGSVTVARATNNAYDKGYEAGWKKAASYITRSGNEIYGPSPKSIDVSKKYYVANYSESSYTAASHSDSYTSASLKIGDTNYSSQKLSVDVSYLSGKLEYNPSSHSHSYTEASYSASSFSWTDNDT